MTPHCQGERTLNQNQRMKNHSQRENERFVQPVKLHSYSYHQPHNLHTLHALRSTSISTAIVYNSVIIYCIRWGNYNIPLGPFFHRRNRQLPPDSNGKSPKYRTPVVRLRVHFGFGYFWDLRILFWLIGTYGSYSWSSILKGKPPPSFKNQLFLNPTKRSQVMTGIV